MEIKLDSYEFEKIEKITLEDKETFFYDIETKDDSLFFISNDNQKDRENYLVHNCDGIHIKGLIMNFFEDNWPELLQQDFLYEFITPVLKARKGKEEKSFYTIKSYKNWLSKNPKGWQIKYYKGLGTSTPKEGKEYFKDIESHLLPFKWDGEENHDKIDLIFNSKRSNERKKWMLSITPKDIEKYKTPTPISSFLDNEMITFSLDDVNRSIPNVYDGLKPSQRKILYTILSKNINKDYPVASLGGVVKSLTKYHHGESSLEQGIIGMAQDFVGSNNLPLLEPVGGFGTRLKGGGDAASPRYLNTHMSKVLKYIFKEDDNDILDHLTEDGYTIEPEFFKPIIPVVLINGSEGIGTGWSTSIPKYKPGDVIRLIENKINNKNSRKIKPWYNGFKGSINPVDNGWETKGIYEFANSTTMKITELPIGVWNYKVKENLIKLQEKGFIRNFTDNSTDQNVEIIINISKDKVSDFKDNTKLEKLLPIKNTIYTSNMNLFKKNDIIKYESPYKIIDDFYEMRLEDYKKRKKVVLDKIRENKLKIENQVKFIKFVITNKIKVNNQKKELIEKDLIKHKFTKINGDFNYLFSMSMMSLTKEKVSELEEKYREEKTKYQNIKRKNPKDIWLEDLNELKKII
jgi:DNA topoisomerase-2